MLFLSCQTLCRFAPLYYDVFPAVQGVRSKASLKGILPGEERLFEISAGGDEPKLTLESDRLDDGQSIGFDAALEDLDGGR